MARVRIKYVQAFVDRKTGKTFYYYRRKGYPLTRLPGPPGSPAFMDTYRRVAKPITTVGTSIAGSASAAIAAYYQSRAWLEDLSAGTQGMRRPILEKFRAKYGELPLRQMHREHIEKYLDDLAPHAAKNALKAIRGWLRHAKHDVTEGIKRKAKSKRYHTWTPEEIKQFEDCHPIGTKARLCFALARYTGAATSDLARMVAPRGGEIWGERKKTGVCFGPVTVNPTLKTVIDATPSGHLTLLVTKSGRPFRATDLSEQFRTWCDEAKLPQRCVIHGLRHHMGAVLAGRGKSALEIAAVLGHSSSRMAEHYTKEMNRQRMAREATKGLDDDTPH